MLAVRRAARRLWQDVRTLLPRASAATVGIGGNGSGVIVTPDGYVDAKEIGRSHAHDVVLLRVDPDGLGLEPLAWPSTSTTSASGAVPGAFVAIASPVGQPPSGVGVVSVGVRPVRDIAMMMGMEFDEVEAGGVRIVRLTPGGVAAKSDLRIGDVFTHINDEAIASRDDLFAELSRPGRQKVTIVMQRDGKPAKAGFALRGPERHATDERVNRHRNGFPACLQHDADLKPEDCGGPLIDIDGTIIGINIARGSHSAALAIPAETVRHIFQELRPDGS